MYPRDGRGVGLFPTNGGQTCVGVAWRHNEADDYRHNLEDNFLKTLELVPGLAERVRAGERTEPFVGTPGIPNLYRKPFGPGWALVGDAGYIKDPITAQGITDAFRDAELLAQAVDKWLSGLRPLEDALEGYELRRNEASTAMYEFTCGLATLDPPPAELAGLLRALVSNQAETDRFLGVIAGTVAVPDFFSTESVERIMAAA
jgi:flavin-dependent dehydrogenase